MTWVRMSKHWPTPLGAATVNLEAEVTDGHARVEVKMPRMSRSMGWDTKNEGDLLEAEVLHKLCTLLAECLADEIRAYEALREQKPVK